MNDCYAKDDIPACNTSSSSAANDNSVLEAITETSNTSGERYSSSQ